MMDDATRRPAAEIEIVAPCSKAFEHMKQMLFPFKFQTWLVLGFVAWLAMLGQGGGGINYTRSKPWSQSDGGGGSAQTMRQGMETGLDYLRTNAHWLVPVVIGAFLIVIAIGAALMYLSSRGLFMYLDCIYRREAGVSKPWRRAKDPAWSLFLWRLLFGGLSFFVWLLVLGSLVALNWDAIRSMSMTPRVIPSIIVGGLLFVVSALCFGMIGWLLRNLIAPIMYLRGINGTEAWHELRGLVEGRVGKFALYWLLNVALGLMIGAGTGVAICVTCCIGLLPVVCQTIIQPLLLWVRAYPFYFLAQFGDAYPPPPEVVAVTDIGPIEDASTSSVVNCPECGQPHQVQAGSSGTYACVKCGAHFEVA